MSDRPWDKWEPIEYTNEVGQSRWQARAGDEKLWKDGIKIFGGQWLTYGTYGNHGNQPKLFRSLTRAAVRGKRRYRKKAGDSWTRRFSETEQMDRAVAAEQEKAVYAAPPLPPPSGWITQQADHGEEVWE